MKLQAKARLISAIAGLAVLSVGCGVSAGRSGDQGWDNADRKAWYRATQGSRLMPESWFMALEQAEADAPFSDPANLTSFGFIAPPANLNNGLPIGFAKDKQADRDLKVSGLKWYVGQKSGKATAEQWIGLNCAACHTAKISYQGQQTIIDGGPNLLDFQLFIEALDGAMKATQADQAKWDRFNAAVLDGKDTPENRALLKTEFQKLLAWQVKTDAMNETPVRYGFGRLDAVGHILNKILMFNGAAPSQGNASNAPVSYPFLWDIWRQEQVQWNGVAQNSRFQLPGDTFEYGALGRNAGEVLGVFGEVVITPKSGTLDTLKGYVSSVQSENLAGLERILKDLKAPAWPAYFPPIDAELVAEGRPLFETSCASCHTTPQNQTAGEKTEVMVSFERTQQDNPEDLTDIWMACNAFLNDGPTGPMAGTKDLNGEIMDQVAPVANMLAAAVQGSILGDKSSLVHEGFRNFFGIRRVPDVFEAARADDRAECLNTKNEPLLAYKARPLDGIWATAPYLHNGSVSSLYELLLPAEQRAKSFWVGNREYDPVNVGYVSTKPEGDIKAFLLRARDGAGQIIEGNSNKGHEYGARNFKERQRRALLEYMKTL